MTPCLSIVLYKSERERDIVVRRSWAAPAGHHARRGRPRWGQSEDRVTGGERGERRLHRRRSRVERAINQLGFGATSRPATCGEELARHCRRPAAGREQQLLRRPAALPRGRRARARRGDPRLEPRRGGPARAGPRQQPGPAPRRRPGAHAGHPPPGLPGRRARGGLPVVFVDRHRTASTPTR